MRRTDIQLARVRDGSASPRPPTHDPVFGATERPQRPAKRRRSKEPMEERRARMRREGAKLMARYGLGNIALTDVARACGIPRGSTYYYYNGWEELLADVIDQHILDLHDRVGDADDVHADDPPEARLVAIAQAFLDIVREQEAEHRVQFAALHALPAPVAEGLRLKHRWLAARIGEAIVAALPELDTRPDLLVPASMSFLSLAGASVLWFRDDGRLARADYARMLALMVLDGTRRMLATPPAG